MYKKLIDETNNVYERLQDEISRNIYKAHMMNGLTYDYSYISQIEIAGIDVFAYLVNKIAIIKAFRV